jgi:hypothetical protein
MLVIGPTFSGVNTFWGREFLMFELFASWLNLLRPQHHDVPTAVTAHANSSPADNMTGFLIDVV